MPFMAIRYAVVILVAGIAQLWRVCQQTRVRRRLEIELEEVSNHREQFESFQRENDILQMLERLPRHGAESYALGWIGVVVGIGNHFLQRRPDPSGRNCSRLISTCAQ